jgi:hypothetical protein
MINIDESGLTFGPYDSERVFRIEKSPTITAMQGIKTCEFLLLCDLPHPGQSQSLNLIEAKSSIPNPNQSAEKYALFFSELFEKFDNSLVLGLLGSLGRFDEIHTAIPDAFKNIYWPSLKLKLILVIPTAPITALAPLSDKLRSYFTRQQSSWKIHPLDIVVLNEQLARKHRLI